MNPQEPNILATPQPSQSLPGSDDLALAAAGFAQQPAQATNFASPSIAGVVGPDVAEDKDVIEKVWVHHAEQIVAKTKRDPRQQAKALNALKADYMSKRYGKEVKVVDD